MNKKLGITILVLAVLGAGFYFYDKSNKQVKAPTAENSQVQPQPTPTPTPPVAQTPTPIPATPNPTPSPTPQTKPLEGTFSDGEEMEGPDIQVKEVVYDGKAFTPATVEIKVGDYVIFRNNSNSEFWPASNPHPVHTDFSAFDPKAPIAAGGKYQFQFTQAGIYKYHDHLNPMARGTVNVTK
jgi:plastocyanin